MNSFQENGTAPKLRHAVQHAHDKVLILPASIADHQCHVQRCCKLLSAIIATTV
jgi:hypothetical protein